MKTEKITQMTDGQIADSTTLGAALNDLKRYAEPHHIEKAEKLTDDFADVVSPRCSTFQVAMAALMFARKALLIHKDAMAELDAEIEARDARIAARANRRKAA